MSRILKHIFHMSDIHFGEPGVTISEFSNVIEKIEKKAASVDSPLLLVTGDVTTEGLREEYEAFEEVYRTIGIPKVIVPGNHDERNYGAAHFEELFGERFKTYEDEHIALYAADSAEPDNDAGHVGRGLYDEIRNFFAGNEDKTRVFALHHHLLPVPHTGREYNVVEDSGDVLGLLNGSGCNLVLNGHRHVPCLWKLNDMALYTTGTLLSKRIRGATTQVYTEIEIYEDKISFTLQHRDGSERKFAQTSMKRK